MPVSCEKDNSSSNMRFGHDDILFESYRTIYNYSYFCSFKIQYKTKDEKEHVYV